MPVDASVSIDVPNREDLEELAELFHEDMLELGVPTSLERQRELVTKMLEDLESASPQCVCWVAREEGAPQRVSGLIMANCNWSPKFQGRSLWIESLYVPEHGRRRGIGRGLVDHLLDWAEDHGIEGIDIEAYRGNTPASVLYRTMGFRRLGRERFFYNIEH